MSDWRAMRSELKRIEDAIECLLAHINDAESESSSSAAKIDSLERKIEELESEIEYIKEHGSEE